MERKWTEGARKFLDRIWRLLVTEEGTLAEKVTTDANANLEKAYHHMVKTVTNHYENLRFNTGISQLMIFINEAYKQDTIPNNMSKVSFNSCHQSHHTLQKNCGKS